MEGSEEEQQCGHEYQQKDDRQSCSLHINPRKCTEWTPRGSCAEFPRWEEFRAEVRRKQKGCRQEMQADSGYAKCV